MEIHKIYICINMHIQTYLSTFNSMVPGKTLEVASIHLINRTL